MLFKELNTIDDLKYLEIDYTDQTYFTITEGSITTIKNVRKINGSLSISNPYFQDFGDIQEIEGSLEVSSKCKKLTSLGQISKINGDLNLRFSSIETLSKLKIVNGNINLKDSKILDLGELSVVNGFLLLSKQMKSRFSFDNIKVTKQIKFYSEYQSPLKEIVGLLKSDKNIIPWDPGYIYSYDELNRANKAQQEFYQYFKEQFLSNKFIDLESNNSYAFILMFDLLKSIHGSNKNDFEYSLLQLASNYPITDSYVYDNLMFHYDSIGDYENGFKYYIHRNMIDLTVFSKYQNLIKQNLFTSDIIIRLTGQSFLTEFGQKNITCIKPFIINLFNEFEQSHKTSFLNVFIDYPIFYKKQKLHPDNNPSFLKGFDPLYYKKFFFSEAEYEYHHQNDLFKINSNYDRGLTHIVEKAIICQLRKFVLTSENYNTPRNSDHWLS
jgi:hypothetical protein